MVIVLTYISFTYLGKLNVEEQVFKFLSWTTIVVQSRDNQEIGMAHKVKSPENQPQFS